MPYVTPLTCSAVSVKTVGRSKLSGLAFCSCTLLHMHVVSSASYTRWNIKFDDSHILPVLPPLRFSTSRLI